MSLDKKIFQAPIFGDEPLERRDALLPLLRQQMREGATRNAAWAAFLRDQAAPLDAARTLEELPFLPVSVFKREDPFCFLDPGAIHRVLTSSATTGQIPSRVALDKETAKLMTRGVTATLADFVGPKRRPYLVLDAPTTGHQAHDARSAAVQALMSFATETCFALDRSPDGELELAEARVRAFCAEHAREEVLIYGFTFLVWQHLGANGAWRRLGLRLPAATLLHSGGWKRVQQLAVDKGTFNREVAETLGAASERVLDYYGMVEHLGVVYPDCAQGNKHVPRFADVILRRPVDWRHCRVGESGMIQLLSALAPSFPGQSLLTEDLGTLVHEDGCPCGRRGIAFRFEGRVPAAEVRGCSDTSTRRGA